MTLPFAEPQFAGMTHISEKPGLSSGLSVCRKRLVIARRAQPDVAIRTPNVAILVVVRPKP